MMVLLGVSFVLKLLEQNKHTFNKKEHGANVSKFVLGTPCSLGLSATSQQYFSLRTKQPPATSQQFSSLRRNQHQPSATSQPNRLEFAANVHTIESPSGCVSSTHRLIQISNAEALRPNEARWSAAVHETNSMLFSTSLPNQTTSNPTQFHSQN
jgi:hypothetical protein